MGKAERKKARTAKKAEKAQRRSVKIAEMHARVEELEQQIAEAVAQRQAHGLPRLRLQILLLKLKLSTKKWRIKPNR